MATLNLGLRERLDIIVTRGDTFSVVFIILNNGYDLTGHQVMMDIKTVARGNQAATRLVRLSTADGGMVIQSPTQLLAVKNASSMTIPAGIYEYDVQWVTPTGVVKTFCGGSFKVNQDVTDTSV